MRGKRIFEEEEEGEEEDSLYRWASSTGARLK